MNLTDDSVITFGKHKGKKLADVPASYLMWVYDTITPDSLDKADLLGYIAKNYSAIRQDAEAEDDWNGQQEDALSPLDPEDFYGD